MNPLDVFFILTHCFFANTQISQVAIQIQTEVLDLILPGAWKKCIEIEFDMKQAPTLSYYIGYILTYRVIRNHLCTS